MAAVEHAQVTGEAIDEVVNTVVDAEASVAPARYFTVPGIDPFDAIEWELRDAHIPGKDGPTFEQRDVEFPKFWSQTATNIVAQKYFRGRMASPERERSVKQMIGRVVDTIGGWGREGGYFATDEEADTFEAELKAILVNQYASFNSPVWFNVGFEASPQCSACQPWRARVSTPEGMVPIGQLVEEEQIGREVYDANGITRIVAVKANGLKEVFRVTLRNGSFVEATGDHVVKAAHSRRSQPAWLRVDELRPGMRMHLHPHRAKVVDRALVPVGGGTAALEDERSGDPVAVAEAALAGWLQADGFVGQYEQGTNRSLTLEFQVANEDEYRWVVSNLDLVFPDVHRHVRDVATRDASLRCRRIRLYGEGLRDFVDRWQLLLRGTAIRVPEVLWTASRDEILAYLQSIFQADGYVSVRHDHGNENARIGFAVIGERWAEDVQLLLNLVGIYSRRTRKPERRENRHDLHEVSVSIGSERARFAELVGFVGADKQQKLLESLALRGLKTCPDLREEEIVSIESLGVEDVYDIQTESGEYLSNNIAVHNCFILSIEDSMESILDWIRREGIIFRGGSGSGLNLSRLRSSKEQLSKGGYASGPVSFMRGADASAGTIKSGGKTRRAAKMVVLDVDHPDVEEFIWCKAKEERKARVLEQAGYDMSLNSADWASIQYQNANNSVRVTDQFMEAVLEGKEWNLTARTDGSVVETTDARDLLRQIAEAAWECADPGVQYDTTINAWHTLPNTGRINASNPCSEYMSIDDSACNLASLNLMKFRREDGEFDVEAFEHAVDVVFLAQEIAVGYSSYPTPEIGRNAKAFRQLGLGYANLGALLMARGLPYDSDEGRAYAAAITALMTGRGYRKSAEVAKRMGPFAGYQPNAAAMIGVIAKHRAAVGNIDHAHSVPDDLLSAARRAWDDALSLGEVSGFRNAQATVLAPTGCLVGDSLVSTSRGLVRLRTLGDPVGEKWQDLDVQVATDEGARNATQFYVNGFEQVVSIETGRGYRIQGTPTHRIKVVDASGEWQWRRFAEIREGDRVPLMLNGMVGDPQTVELPPLGDLYWTADFRSRVPRQMTTELAELVGYFMGDGSLHAKGLRFCVAREDEDVVERLVDLIASLFGLDAATSDKGGYTEVSVNSVPLVLWWEACGFAKLPPSAEHSGKGWHAHIPDAVLHTNDREIYAAFIRGLFEADGTTANGYVSWSTVTETFSRDVQTLLLALGFVTTRKVDLPGTSWGANDRFVLRLLNVAASERYLEEIDFISVRKAAQPWTGEHRQALTRRGDVSRRSATALLERTADPELEHLLGFYYDTVATVETLDDQPTYDISVPDNVTYVANGFVSHNTISFMMDCDTTGVEPDFSLVKSKRLVGGGEITIVNKTVPMALAKLGYSPTESDEIVAFIDERNTVVGAPYVKTDHYPVFDCAIGDRAIHYMGHVKMMGAVQPFISGAISKCVVADTLVTSGEGLVRIGSLHHGEREDSFRSMKLSVASLDGLRTTDAFYYGGERETIEVVLGSGHRIVGTPNHRLLVALPAGGLDWKSLDELEEGDQVATQYGDDVWSERPASFDDFAPSALHGSQKVTRIPEAMSEELAFFLGAYAAEGHTARSNHTVRIANADETVIARLVELVRSLFAIEPRVARFEGKCPSVEVSSKTLVEFLDYLGCGDRARNKRIPDAVLRSPRSMVLAFLEGLSLDSYLPASLPKWAICLASNGLLDDLQAVLTNLGVVHNRITKHNAAYDTSFDEVYAHGREAQKIASLLRFPEAHKQARAAALLDLTIGWGTSDLVPGIRGSDLYDLVPRGRSGRTGRSTGTSREFSHLVDPRTAQVSRASLEAVATMPGVELPDWLEVVLQQNLHFSPVAVVREAGVREVYDVSVPVTHAFVGNGIVNHNTVNLPEEITVDEISQLLIESWQLGVKAIAIYRDNCKVAQPLSKKGDAGATTLAPVSGVVGALPQRRRLPDDRMEVGRKFKVGEYEGYIHVGLFEDGTPGDIFVDIAKEGTTLAGLMNSFMISVSLGLQYGVPLEVYVSKFSHMRFEPSGMTNDPDIRVAKSIVDYIFRWMGKKFLSADQQEEAGILTPEVKARLAAAYADAGSDAAAAAAVLEPVPPGQTALFNQWEDAQECARCGGRMVRTGSCYTCRDCGTNTGCS